MSGMQISLQSDNYDIVAYGQAFLFGKDKDFTINVTADDDFSFSIVLKFLEDPSVEQKIVQTTGDGNEMILLCSNFVKTGTGTSAPVKIAEIEKKGLYFMFWSFLDGEKNKEVRSVRYTIFYER